MQHYYILCIYTRMHRVARCALQQIAVAQCAGAGILALRLRGAHCLAIRTDRSFDGSDEEDAPPPSRDAYRNLREGAPLGRPSSRRSQLPQRFSELSRFADAASGAKEREDQPPPASRKRARPREAAPQGAAVTVVDPRPSMAASVTAAASQGEDAHKGSGWSRRPYRAVRRGSASAGDARSDGTSSPLPPSDHSGNPSVDAAAYQRAFNRALRVMERMYRTAAELRAKLCDEGHAPAIVDAVVNRLIEIGVQSDAQFAESYVRVRWMSLQKAPQMLKQVGVPVVAALQHCL